MTAPPKRRWFRFGLRAMFVLVAIVATWLGYHINLIHQRRALHAWIIERGGEVIEIDLSSAGLFENRSIPWYRRWLGDRSLGLIVMPDDANSDGTTESYGGRAVKLSQRPK